MSMRIVKLLVVVVSAALLVPPVFAGEDDPGGPGGNAGNGVCRADGAWVGGSSDGTLWTAILESESNWGGPFTLNATGVDASFGGLFPATMMSPYTGTWVKTGPRTAEYTMMAYGLGPDETTGVMIPIFISKSSGYVELTGRCDGFEGVSVSVALYLPTQDPFGDDPPYFGCFPDGALLTARRIPAEPPCEPAPP